MEHQDLTNPPLQLEIDASIFQINPQRLWILHLNFALYIFLLNCSHMHLWYSWYLTISSRNNPQPSWTLQTLNPKPLDLDLEIYQNVVIFVMFCFLFWFYQRLVLGMLVMKSSSILYVLYMICCLQIACAFVLIDVVPYDDCVDFLSILSIVVWLWFLEKLKSSYLLILVTLNICHPNSWSYE